MSTEPPTASRDGKVVPLRAVDAQTEVRLDEAEPPGPSYVDLTSGEAKRRPIIPEHWRTRENAKRHVSSPPPGTGTGPPTTASARPATSPRRLGFAVWGVVVTDPAPDPRGGTSRARPQLEHQAAADGLLNDHLRLHKQGKETRKQRGTILALCLAGAGRRRRRSWPCSRRGGRGRWPRSRRSRRSRWPGARRARPSPPGRSCPPRCSRRPRT